MIVPDIQQQTEQDTLVYVGYPDRYARWADFLRALRCCYIELIVILLFFALMSHDQTAEVLRINASLPADSVLNYFYDWTPPIVWVLAVTCLGVCVGAHANYVLQRNMGSRFGNGEKIRERAASIIGSLCRPLPSSMQARFVDTVQQIKWNCLDDYVFTYKTRDDLKWLPFALGGLVPALGIYGMLRAMDLTDFFGAGMIANIRLSFACFAASISLLIFWHLWRALRADEQVARGLRVFAYVALVFLVVTYILNFLAPADFASAHYIPIGWLAAVLASLMVLNSVSEHFRIPLVTFFLFAFVLFEVTGFSNNHTIRWQTSQPNAKPAQEAFKSWRDARSSEIEKFKAAKKAYPIFIVAAEGGGIRAAYMTNAVLAKLELDNPDFLRHTFAIIGVSGGSVGAAMFSASHLSPARTEKCGKPAAVSGSVEARTPHDAARATLSSDLLSPTLSSLFGLDFVARFLPGAYIGLDVWDRGAALEDAIDAVWRGYGQRQLRGVCFSQAWAGATGDLPALILLATDVRSGERLAASHLQFLPSNPNGAGDCSAEPPAGEARLRTLAAELPKKDIPLLTAAVMSARFPIISPSAGLPCSGGARRVVDGGYFENSGVTTVLELLDAIAPETTAPNDLQVMVLRIANSDASTGSVWTRNGGSTFGRLMPDPITALLNTQDSRAAVAISNLESRLGGNQLTFGLTPSPVAIPLGWLLGKAAQDEIDRQVSGEANASAFTRVSNALSTGQQRQ
jgi:hypothetical protein